MSEVNALKTLRETTLAHLSQSDYEKILKAVEVGGIDSLTGTAAMVVKSAVLKHGSHDQSSHNPKKGGGGGGGGGGGSTTSTRSEVGEIMSAEIDAAKDDLAMRMQGAEMVSVSSKSPSIKERSRGTVEGFEDARELVGKKDAFAQAKAKANGARKNNIGNPDLLDKAYKDGYYDAIISAHNQYGNLDGSIE
jgi:hypothetical protein